MIIECSISKQALMSKLVDLNEEAHQAVIDTWREADRLEDEDLSDQAEDKREQASEEQAEYFEELFDQLPGGEQEAVWHYVETDPEGFGDEFYQWYRD